MREAEVVVDADEDDDGCDVTAAAAVAMSVALLLADAVVLPFRAADFKAETMDARMDSGLEGGVSG